ncbi:YdeI/OmpD-associated family protein [Lacibacter sp.]|uniref:YdeI/OmpD-associated family protein n=1 Tax=Lacibacter sp. TaxID=1915409 RepID=UPI002B4B3584|nr:YdeI/OmpD-associated family protein [Lacibacter sp.]HLP39476.1 YdeI/OmpD-associated family protein [Lacibacter sp.]
MDEPLINKKFLLKKYPGKGGWVYSAIPEVVKNKKSPFGWVRVKGFIDNYEFKNYRLMPMGNGQLFLPVKAEIRKMIRKKEGDYVHIILYADNDPVEIPEELKLCLLDHPVEYKTFLGYTYGEQKAFINWIDAAKTDETKVNRIAKTLDKLLKKQKFTKK